MKQIKPQYNCSLELAMELVGGKWKLVLLWHLLSGTKRFSETKRSWGHHPEELDPSSSANWRLPGCLPGRFIRSSRPHMEYSLTERGMELAPVLRGLCAWSGKYAVEKGITLAPLPPSRDGKDLPGAAESFPEA